MSGLHLQSHVASLGLHGRLHECLLVAILQEGHPDLPLLLRWSLLVLLRQLLGLVLQRIAQFC